MQIDRVERLSLSQARRIALAAQGFARPRPKGRVDIRHLRRLIDEIGVLQLDAVNVFCRSHYLPALSRLGPYPRELLDAMASHQSGPTTLPGRGDLIEYWAHEASLIPARLRPMLRWRMERAGDEAWAGIRRLADEAPDFIERIFGMVATSGPVRSRDVVDVVPRRQQGVMWDRHDGKIALEYLFWCGRVMASSRVNFERRYDIPERVLTAADGGVLDRPAQQRELVRVAARALGVGTSADIADYFRMPAAETRTAVEYLLDAGELRQVEVTGWSQNAYLWHAAARPRKVTAQALLSPFDSLIWSRPRTERLFDFHYRLEIYTPAPQRKHGYYVLPFLLGEDLVARVDLKSDRASSALAVRGAFAESRPDVLSVGDVAKALADSLSEAAQWLGLSTVSVTMNGTLAAPLARALDDMPTR